MEIFQKKENVVRLRSPLILSYLESSLESNSSSCSSCSLPVGALLNFPEDESTNSFPGVF